MSSASEACMGTPEALLEIVNEIFVPVTAAPPAGPASDPTHKGIIRCLLENLRIRSQLKRKLEVAAALPAAAAPPSVSSIRRILAQLRGPATAAVAPTPAVATSPAVVASQDPTDLAALLGWAVDQYLRTQGRCVPGALAPRGYVSAAMLLAFLRVCPDDRLSWGLAHSLLGLDAELYWWLGEPAASLAVVRRRELECVVRACAHRTLLRLHPAAILARKADPELHVVQLVKNAKDVLLQSLWVPPSPPSPVTGVPVAPLPPLGMRRRIQLRFRMHNGAHTTPSCEGVVATTGARTVDCRRVNESEHTHYGWQDAF